MATILRRSVSRRKMAFQPPSVSSEPWNVYSGLDARFRCTEFLSDSPSTSAENVLKVVHHHRQPEQIHQQHARRRSRGILQPLPGPSAPPTSSIAHPVPSAAAQPTPEPRPISQPCRKRSLDQKLNMAQHPSIRTSPVDRGIHGNPQGFQNLLRAEEMCCVNSHYFEAVQEQLTVHHREAAVDWLYDVSKDCRADPGVLPLAVSLIDRFLSVQNIFQRDIQALAGTCFFISSKMKEPQPLNARRMSDYTADSVPVNNILSWELLVLSQLGWDLATPTAVDFFDFISAHYPRLSMLRPAYVEILHKMQRSHKLALFVPSLQSCLSLLHAASNQSSSMLLADARHCISELFQNELSLLEPYLCDIDMYCLGRTPRAPPRAPPCSSEERSSPEVPQVREVAVVQDVVQAGRSSLPATPLNDSGFCSVIGSSACSPDAAQRISSSSSELDSDCSPPKMRRLSSD